jgi:post-segregation antitoxin (ccd killing protein)
MKMTVYLPDELAAEVKAELGGDTNISAICQAALRAELVRARAMAKLNEDEFERVETTSFDRNGSGHDVAFQGKQVGGDPDRGTAVYLTPKGALAVVGEGRNANDELLAIYDDYDSLVNAGYPFAMMTEVADSLGEDPPVEELDI